MSSSTHTENTTPTLQDRHLDTDKCPSCMTSVAGGRRLVVAFDGTENQFGLLSSHVLEFHSRIVQNDDQISHYNSGIGTFVKPSSFTRLLPVWIKNKWAAAVAPNFNFDSNLLSGYRFLSEKYQKGDRIFLVGFSRGAYQARVLAAMIARVGLLRAGSDELIPLAFKTYTDPKNSEEIPRDSGEPDGPKTTIAEEFKEAFCNDVKIHFVGVWDTVSSVGLFRNKYYPGAELAEGICFFRHALAIDERRVKFIPEYIVASSKDFLPGELGEPRCKEVWFRGYHSDIGGGNKENITRDNGAIPSRWMVYEAKLAGLKMTKFPRSKESALKPGPDSMTQLYKVLEYADPLVRIIKWEIHSKDRPPLLDDEGKPPPRVFTRTCHRERPRQIYSHHRFTSFMLLYQKPEISVEETFADRQVPDSWLRVDQSDRLYDWNEYISRLRIDKQNTDQALDLFRSDADLAGFPWATSLQPVRVALATAAQPPLQPVPNEPGPSVHSFSQPGTPEPIATPMQSSDRLVHDAQANQPIVPPTADASVLPPKSIESDILDGGGIPTLIAAVLRRTNVEEFLELLGVQACTETGKMTIRQDNRRQFSLMIQQVCRDQKYVEYTLAIRVAYHVFWGSDVDLYDSDKDLWMAILTVVERWDNSQTDSTTASSSLLRAGRLLHQTKNGDALDEIKRALVGVFNRWQKSATEHASAPNQLHVLATAMEDSSNVEDYVFPLTALSAPHFSDAGFKTPLLLCLAKLINTVGGATGKRATLWFCVFRATDNVPFDRKLITRTFFGAMKEIWDLVMPETPNPNRMTELKNLLQEDRIKNALRGIEDDRSWALLALEKASNPQQITLPFEYSLVDPTGLKLIAERQET